MKTRTFTVISLVIVTSVIFAGCGHGAKGSGSDSGANSSQTVRVGTNRALGTVVPFVAKKQGYFSQQGIQVDVVDFAVVQCDPSAQRGDA